MAYHDFDPNQDFSPNDPDGRRAADQVRALIAEHPEGITFREFAKAYRSQITVDHAAIAAIRLLFREDKIYSNEPWDGSGGFLDHVKLYARA